MKIQLLQNDAEPGYKRRLVVFKSYNFDGRDTDKDESYEAVWWPLNCGQIVLKYFMSHSRLRNS